MRRHRYPLSEVEKLTGATRSQILHWARMGIVAQPSGAPAALDFIDVFRVAIARRLADVPMAAAAIAFVCRSIALDRVRAGRADVREN